MLSKKLLNMLILAGVFTLMCVGAVYAAVEKGPYLIYEGTDTGMTVLWQLDNSQICTIRWGLDQSYTGGNADISEYGGDHQYRYTVSGLSPGTKYYYQVDGIGSGSFYTAPADSAADVKLLVYGDTRTYPADQDAVNARMIATYSADPGYQTITLHVGDWVANGDSEADWTGQFFDPAYINMNEFQANMPINGCRGNHEGAGNLYKKYFPYPYEPGGFYWSFDYGPAHIAVLDMYIDYTPGSTQYTWLENDLKNSNKQWKFLVFHEPGWSADSGHSNNTDIQNYIQPLCLTYGVDVVFAGHNHYYARCEVDGVEHITTGGGGAPLRTPDTGYPYVVSTAKAFHFCKIDIRGNQLDFEAVDNNGSVLDAFSIIHPLPEGYAGSDIPVKGRVSGSYLDTRSSDNIYEAVTERLSGGKPQNRYSFLEHKWTLNLPVGRINTFYVEAYQTQSPDNDHFVFAYSTDDQNYTDMLAVTKTYDDDAAQSYQFPGYVSGDLYVRVKDTDRTPGNKSMDTIYIDKLYITSEDSGNPDTAPPEPDPMTWETAPYATGDSAIAMAATPASDPSGVEYYFECIAGTGHDSGWQSGATYEDTGLQPDTQYTYTVKARDKSANQNQTGTSEAASATTDAGCMPASAYVASISAETVRGSKGKRYGRVTVVVYDNCGDPVPNAQVKGGFSGDFNESLTGTTDSSGAAVIMTTTQTKKPKFRFCVDDVVGDLTYFPWDNIETCDGN